MTLSEYRHLKEQLVISFNHSERQIDLSTLKEIFRDDINSPRKYEKIATIGQLLRILEIRDVLSENNVGALKDIAGKLHNNELLQRIREYELSHGPEEFANYYVSEPIRSTPQRPYETFIASNPNTVLSDAKKQQIVDTIVDNIGTFWRDLARSLEIKEKFIDELEASNIKTEEKAQTIMDMYQKHADKQNWFFELCDALEVCRRKDLVKRLKKIITKNI